jgi:hypothetical protein
MNIEITILKMKWNLVVVGHPESILLASKFYLSLQVLAFFPSPEPIFKDLCKGWNFWCKEKTSFIMYILF